MKIHWNIYDFIAIGIYFLAVFWIGLKARRKNSNATEFLLAGRTLTLPIFVMTLVSTWYGGIMGVGEYSYKYGISNWVTQGVPYYFFAFLFALFLAKKIRKTEFVTIPDQFRKAYGPKTAILGTFLTFIICSPASNILGLTILLELITGWSHMTCIFVSVVSTLSYLYVGGFRADVHTDVLEFFLMFLGIAVMVPYSVMKFGGISYLQHQLPASHWTLTGGTSVQYLVTWFFVALWTLVDPEFYQRCFAAKTESIAKKGILISILFWILFDFMTTTLGLYAKGALPNLDNPMMAYPALAEVTLPPFIKGFFYIGMLATVMSSLNSSLFVSAETVGRDLLWRTIGNSSPKTEKKYVQIGLGISSLFAITLTLLFPSIVDLWYTLGTIVIPGLLIPLVTSFSPRLKVNGKWGFASMALGWLSSLGWMCSSWVHEFGSSKYYPFGIEPIFVGLGLSFIVWLLGLIGSSRTVPDS